MGGSKSCLPATTDSRGERAVATAIESGDTPRVAEEDADTGAPSNNDDGRATARHAVMRTHEHVKHV
jgi:hypothetical protein